MRKMRLAKRELREQEQLQEIVDTCQTVRVGYSDDEGMAIVPMSFGYEWTGDDAEAKRLVLWLHSAGEGRKADAFSRNGEAGVPVAIEMDIEDGLITGDYSCAYSYAYRSIMGAGTIRPAVTVDEKRHGLDRIMEHLAPGYPTGYSDEALERVFVWRVDLDHITGKQRAPK